MNILIITEANDRVASGHFYESIAIAKRLIGNGHFVKLLYNSDINPEWKKLATGIPSGEYLNNTAEGEDDILKVFQTQSFRVILTDLREVTNEFVVKLRDATKSKIVCLDEWGNRFLSCDVIVNNMMDESFWKYEDSTARLYLGAKYLILSEKLRSYHEREKIISEKVQRIVVSMGGVDIKNSTAKIVEYLLENHFEGHVDIVLGAANPNKGIIEQLIRQRENYCLHQNIDYIYDLFYKADLAFCAGGNTLYELASIGTPTIVIPTMTHEYKNGLAFQNAGFSEVQESLREETKKFLCGSPMDREQMSKAGKKLIDANGIARIEQIIREVGEIG